MLVEILAEECAACGELLIGCEVVELDEELVHYTEECVMRYIEDNMETYKIPTDEKLKEAAEERKVAEHMEEGQFDD